MTTRLLDHLPAIYRHDSDDLRGLLAAFDELLFTGRSDARATVPGIEHELQRMPALFAPLGVSGDGLAQTPARFLPWIASSLAFAPYRLFEPEQLRRIVAGIVPLYGRRGTRAYMEQLLKLCFDEVAKVHVDERDLTGLCLGRSKIGIDSLLAAQRPFWFSVDVHVQRPAAAAAALDQRLRAVIDFAKPAHTTYDLRMHLTEPEEEPDS